MKNQTGYILVIKEDSFGTVTLCRNNSHRRNCMWKKIDDISDSEVFEGDTIRTSFSHKAEWTKIPFHAFEVLDGQITGMPFSRDILMEKLGLT